MDKPGLNLTNKRILLCVSGGIAAYKAAELLRLLNKAGAQVEVLMTASAQTFVTPLTFQALNNKPVHTDATDSEAPTGMAHIELARWADLIIIAPATANRLAKLAQGMADDLLGATCLASKAPLVVAPAMNQQMWASASTQHNIETLASWGTTILWPDSGEQACGDVGSGRMQEPAAIVEAVSGLFETGLLQGKHVLITAGPTREAIDPVRYISNHSSGKMGYSLARAAVEAGAEVTLVSGPVNQPVPERVSLHQVESAVEMQAAVLAVVEQADIFIATAAVADYRMAQPAAQKLKKGGEGITLELVPNPDILAQVAAMADGPFCVGFAAETENLAQYAQDKLQRKGLDMIAANDVAKVGQGFNAEDNELQVFWPGGQQSLALASKDRIAQQLIALIAQRMQQGDE